MFVMMFMKSRVQAASFSPGVILRNVIKTAVAVCKMLQWFDNSNVRLWLLLLQKPANFRTVSAGPQSLVFFIAGFKPHG